MEPKWCPRVTKMDKKSKSIAKKSVRMEKMEPEGSQNEARTSKMKPPRECIDSGGQKGDCI